MTGRTDIVNSRFIFNLEIPFKRRQPNTLCKVCYQHCKADDLETHLAGMVRWWESLVGSD